MRRLLPLVAALTLSLALAAPVTAITSGVPDGTAHPSTGALVALDPGTGEYSFVCSGSLLADHAFLTAAHCAFWEMVGLGAENAFVTFDPDLQAADPFRWGLAGPVVEPEHVIGLDLTEPRAVMPGFRMPPSGAISRNDVAVLALAGPASAAYPGISPVRLPPAGFLRDRVAGGDLAGHALTLVGYGFDSISWRNPTTPVAFDGRRLVATAPALGITLDHVGLLQNLSATGDGGVCTGDSGGPDFWGPAGSGAADLQVALNVGRGFHDCGIGGSASQRLDLPAVLAFLDPWVD